MDVDDRMDTLDEAEASFVDWSEKNLLGNIILSSERSFNDIRNETSRKIAVDDSMPGAFSIRRSLEAGRDRLRCAWSFQSSCSQAQGGEQVIRKLHPVVNLAGSVLLRPGLSA